jgi:SAM-dependent methyltransferase
MESQLINDIIRWDVRSWSKALFYWDSNIDWSKINNALELGSNEGGLSLWMSLKGIKVVCSDVNDVKKSAEPLHKKYQVETRINYEDISAAMIPYENHFDVIIFKSIIGGIGRDDNYELQKKVFSEVYKALKPGGKLLFAENLIASPLHQFMRRRFIKWGNSWRYISSSEIKEMLSDFSRKEILTTGFLSAFGRNENQRNFFSKVDDYFFNKVTPEKWKYICYGIATK